MHTYLHIYFYQNALKAPPFLKSAHLDQKLKNPVEILQENIFQIPPSYEKLTGDLNRAYFCRINVRHRLVYQVYEQEKVVKIIIMWTHYHFPS